MNFQHASPKSGKTQIYAGVDNGVVLSISAIVVGGDDNSSRPIASYGEERKTQKKLLLCQDHR